MISDIAIFISFLIESCTGIAIIQTSERPKQGELESLIERPRSRLLVGFNEFEEDDHIFQEFDPPENLQADPKAWKKSLPSFRTSLKECLKTVLVIQTLCGSLIGVLVVGIVILDFTFAEWCFSMNNRWYEMPKKVDQKFCT